MKQEKHEIRCSEIEKHLGKCHFFEKSYENTRFFLLILSRFIGNIHTFAGIDCYFRGRQRFCVGDKQCSYTVVADGQFLNPFSVGFLR